MRALVYDPDAKHGLRLAPDGLAVSVGQASREPTTIDFERARQVGAGARVEAFTVATEGGFAVDLAYLVSLLAAGELDPQVGWHGGWNHAGEAAEALFARTVSGKVILDVGSVTSG